MSNWSNLRLANLLPPPAKTAVDAVGTLTDTINTFLAVAETTLSVAKSAAQAAATNPIEATLNATIRELQNTLEGLVKNTSAHAILIPIHKQPFGLGVRPDKDSIPETDRPASFDRLVDDGAFSEDAFGDASEASKAFIDNSSTAVGGNQGFWKTLALSLQDEGDSNRPNFPSNFAVTGVCIIVGATSLQELDGKLNVIKSIFKVNNRTDPFSRSQPSITELNVKVIPDLSESPAKIAVRLSWPSVPPIVAASAFGGELRVIKEIFVIRSTDKKIREQFSWSDVFSRQPLDVSSDLQEEGPTKVIARIKNDGFVQSYIDEDPSLDPTTSYYYAVLPRYEIDGTTQPMGNLSPVRRVILSDPQATVNSEAPDWWASPTLVKMIPSLYKVLQKLEILISKLESRTVSNSGLLGMINQTIEQLSLLSQQLEDVNEEIQSTADKLESILSEGTAGIFSTNISVNKGGTSAWIAELAKRLSDPEDSSRPPFDSGHEFVSGLVIMAGAPRPPELNEIKSLLSLLFGSSSQNPLLDAIDSLEKEAGASAGESSFGDNLQTEEGREDGESTKGFDEGLNPSNDVVC